MIFFSVILGDVARLGNSYACFAGTPRFTQSRYGKALYSGFQMDATCWYGTASGSKLVQT
jgi:hypothetical protein